MSVPAGEAYVPVLPDLSNFGTKMLAQLQPKLAEAEAAAGTSGTKMGGLLGANAQSASAAGFKGISDQLLRSGTPLEDTLGGIGASAGRRFSDSLSKEGKNALQSVFEADVSSAAQKAGAEADAALARLSTGAGTAERNISGSVARRWARRSAGMLVSGAKMPGKMRAQVLSYSRARGLFAGLELNGAVIAQDKDSTREFYGRMVPTSTSLTGEIDGTASAYPFLNTLAKWAKNAADK